MASELKIYQIKSGVLKNKYIAVQRQCDSPFVILQGAQYETFNIPNFLNVNSTSIMQLEVEEVANYSFLSPVIEFTSMNGLAKNGSIDILKSRNYFLLFSNLSTSLVSAYFYGLLSQNTLNGTKITSFQLGSVDNILQVNHTDI